MLKRAVAWGHGAEDNKKATCTVPGRILVKKSSQVAQQGNATPGEAEHTGTAPDPHITRSNPVWLWTLYELRSNYRY